MRGDQADALAGVEILVLLLQIGGDGPHFRFSLLDSDAWFEPSQHLKVAGPSLFFHAPFGIEGAEKIPFPVDKGKIEVRGGNADDDSLFSIEHYSPSDDVRIRSQAPLP